MYESKKITITKQLLERFTEFRLSTIRSGMNGPEKVLPASRWRVNDHIIVNMNAYIESYCTFAIGNKLHDCGAFSSLASSLPLFSRVGRYCSIGYNVRNIGFRHPIESVSSSSAVFNFNRENISQYFSDVEKRDGYLPTPEPVPTPQAQLLPITIGNDVWIGDNVVLKGGIYIGDGAVIAANSLVTKDIEAYAIYAGSPAKLIRYRFEEDIRKQLLESRWWEYELSDLYQIGFAQPTSFINEFFKNKSKLRLASVERISLRSLVENIK